MRIPADPKEAVPEERLCVGMQVLNQLLEIVQHSFILMGAACGRWPMTGTLMIWAEPRSSCFMIQTHMSAGLMLRRVK